MPVQLGLYCNISSYTGRDDVYDVIIIHVYTAATHDAIIIVSSSALHYRRRRPTYLLAGWSCYATSSFPSSNHRPSRDTTPSNTPFQILI